MTVIPEDLDAIEQADELESEVPSLEEVTGTQIPDTNIRLLTYIPPEATAIRERLTQNWKLAERIYQTVVIPLLKGAVYSPRTLQYVVDTATATILQNIIEFHDSPLNGPAKKHLAKLFDKFEEKDPDTYSDLINSGFYLTIRENSRNLLKSES